VTPGINEEEEEETHCCRFNDDGRGNDGRCLYDNDDDDDDDDDDDKWGSSEGGGKEAPAAAEDGMPIVIVGVGERIFAARADTREETLLELVVLVNINDDDGDGDGDDFPTTAAVLLLDVKTPIPYGGSLDSLSPSELAIQRRICD